MSQLYFNFAGSKPSVCTGKKRAKKQKQRELRVDDVTAEDLRDLCVLLHDLARKHVSAANFQDFNTRQRCTKLLETLGVLSSGAADTCARAIDHDATLVLRSPPYRRLRAHAIAGLATVADLAGRAPGKGTRDYQRGVREAFQQASNIAAVFLDEIEDKYRSR